LFSYLKSDLVLHLTGTALSVAPEFRLINACARTSFSGPRITTLAQARIYCVVVAADAAAASPTTISMLDATDGWAPK